MPRTPEQFEQIRDESRARMRDSALRLFARSGYAATSVRMIAEDAGVSQGLLYNYYTGKEALLRAIFECNMQDVEESFARAVATPGPGGELAALVRAAFEIVRENQDFWRLSYQIRMQPEVLESLGKEVRLSSAGIVAHLEQVLRNTGSRRASAQARALFAAIDGSAQHYVLDPEHYPLEEVGEEIIRSFRPSTHS